MARPLDLTTAEFRAVYLKTIEMGRINLDMYQLYLDKEHPENFVTLGVPGGRGDIAEYVERALRAARGVLRPRPDFEAPRRRHG